MSSKIQIPKSSVQATPLLMAALESGAEGARGDRAESWTLPAWEEYSEAASSSFVGDWSDVEADVSLDTASSIASTEHQRVYRIQRARGGFPEDKHRDLSELHSMYTRRRQEESSQGFSSVRSSTNWFQPAPCASPRVEKPLSPVPTQEKQVESELLAQQSEISAELQAVRKQLSDFQDKWKKTVEVRTETQSSGAPTVASSWSSPIPVKQGSEVVVESAVQTERDEREDAVKQWLLLLTQKLETLTRRYSHEPTQNFQAAMTHLAGVWSAKDDGEDVSEVRKETASNNDSREASDAPLLSSWHVGRALKTAVSLGVAEQFLELEHGIACLNAAVEQHERRQMTNFDRAVQQVQGYHHERMQRVVDESLAELKLVRGRYKKKESQLENELRIANKEIEQWKQTAIEAEHRKKLDQETLEFQLSAAKEQHDHARRRYEDDLTQLKSQLETVRAERRQVVNQHRDTHEVISQAKEGAIALERQCQALKKQQERAKELHDREVRVLQDTIRQLREGNDEMEVQHVKEKQIFVDTIEKLKRSQQTEMKELEARVKSDVEQQVMHELLPEKMASLENRHKETISAMESEHKRQIAQLAEKLNETKSTSPPSTRTIETQTDLPTDEENVGSTNIQVEGGNSAQAQIEELTRRCRALEKLLDKKFEDTPLSLSFSHRCESCHSDDGISTSSVLGGRHDLNASRSSSIHSDSSFRPRVSGKSRALARALLGSSRASLNSVSRDNKTPPFMNETTLATDETTLGAQEMWDSASFTSIDSVDDLSSFASQRTTPRQRMRSTQEILTLVRQIKQAAASSLDSRREPDPEVHWETLKRKPVIPPPSISKNPAKPVATSVPGSAIDGVSATTSASAFDDLLC